MLLNIIFIIIGFILLIKGADFLVDGASEIAKRFHIPEIVIGLTIVAIGKMVERAKAIEELLAKENIDAEIINARFLKPLDKETILKSVEKTKNVVTIEDGLIEGGLRKCCCWNN